MIKTLRKSSLKIKTRNKTKLQTSGIIGQRPDRFHKFIPSKQLNKQTKISNDKNLLGGNQNPQL